MKNNNKIKNIVKAAVAVMVFLSVSAHAELVKLSRNNICHAPSSRYYDRTIHYTAYDSLDACLKAGGRLPEQ